RTVIAIAAMLCALAGMGMTQAAWAQEGRGYGEPPQPFNPPITAASGEDEPYIYDMHTSLQVSYWGAVVDGIGQKFSHHVEDITALDSPERMWDAIEEHNISINAREAQVLCLFMREDDDPPPDDVVP